MAKRTIRRNKAKRIQPTSIRLKPDDDAALRMLGEETGWSFNECLTFILSCGWQHLNSDNAMAKKSRSVIAAYRTVHQEDIAAAARVAAAKKVARETREHLSGAQAKRIDAKTLDKMRREQEATQPARDGA